MERVGNTIEVWADVRCPWCWVGHRRLAEAMKLYGRSAQVVRRAFLLEAEGPIRSGITMQEAALGDWGMTRSEWERSLTRIERGGQTEGLQIRTATARIFDSRDAHRLLKLADATEAVSTSQAWEIVFDEHFRLNTDLGDRDQLVRIGVEMRLEEHAVRQTLESSAYVSEVAEDHQDALRRGIVAVPTVVVGEHHLSGTHTAADLGNLLAGMPQVSA